MVHQTQLDGPMPAPPLTARIEVFRPGTFRPMEGEPITYSAADLRAIADAYDPEAAPAPVVVGHPDADAPAFGWVESFDYDAQAERLFANLHQIEPQFADLVKAGRFKKVSMAYFNPSQPHNPVPAVLLGLFDPSAQGLGNTADLGCNGRGRARLRLIGALMLKHHTDRAGADLRRVAICQFCFMS
jgi:hypothetical protein